ncbi:MAG: TIGR03084 family protein [Alphaproteobacteria bacterium]|nr:TIGR03084 family protein [Alphaproteobacteria bacterium]
MEQAQPFQDESEALFAILDPLPEAAFTVPTQFNGWTINDILQHLHHFNMMADLSLNDEQRFVAEYAKIAALRAEVGFVGASNTLLDGLSGRPLLEAWRAYVMEMTPRFAAADPKRRVKWAGPDMSARSSITARLMETWAHGQEIYDLLGIKRIDTDRSIRNIAHLGVNTFGWTFVNRGEAAPQPMPYVELAAPSGAMWTFGERSEAESVKGRADQFCQVVCQTRNIADTELEVRGPVATLWMSRAQCFAGPPKNPPAPGSRCPDPDGLARLNAKHEA